MTLPDSAIIDDARALLAEFVRNGLHSAAVELRPGLELRLNRDPAEPSGTQVAAPHVGTLVERLDAGTCVDSGAVLAVLDLLGERVEVVAPRSGVVTEDGPEVGSLVQYGEAIAWIELDVAA